MVVVITGERLINSGSVLISVVWWIWDMRGLRLLGLGVRLGKDWIGIYVMKSGRVCFLMVELSI